MDKNNQIIIAGALIIILAVGSAAFFYRQSNTESQKIDSLKNEIVLIVQERELLFKKIEKIKKQKKELTLNIRNYSAEIENTETEIFSVKKVKEEMLIQLQEKKQALFELQQILGDINLEESDLKDDLNKAKSDHEDVLQALELMRDKKSILEEKIKARIETSRGIELRKIVVKMADPVNGNIIDVNAEYRFAVIDLGSIDNVRSGELLGIYRNSTLIAKAIVENVYEDMSSIIIFDEWRDVEIFYGDTIQLLKN